MSIFVKFVDEEGGGPPTARHWTQVEAGKVVVEHDKISVFAKGNTVLVAHWRAGAWQILARASTLSDRVYKHDQNSTTGYGAFAKVIIND